jgi:hypothetical protein
MMKGLNFYYDIWNTHVVFFDRYSVTAITKSLCWPWNFRCIDERVDFHIGLISSLGIFKIIQWKAIIIEKNTFPSEQGVVVVVIVWWLDLQVPVQSVRITTKVDSSNPVHGKVYSIQYVIKFVSDVRQVGGFLRILRFPPPIKLTSTI